jgi:hypothetical protein
MTSALKIPIIFNSLDIFTTGIIIFMFTLAFFIFTCKSKLIVNFFKSFWLVQESANHARAVHFSNNFTHRF